MKSAICLTLAATVLSTTYAIRSSQAQTAAPAAPGLECAGVTDPLSVVACSDPQAQQARSGFAQAYHALRQQADEPGRRKLRRDAAEFARATAARCRLPGTATKSFDPQRFVSCVLTSYETQRDAWRALLTGPALEEASRPQQQHLALQARLRELRFLPAEARPDGIYGPATRTAISNWQQSASRPVTGFVSDADAAALLPAAAAAVPAAPPSPAPAAPVAAATAPAAPAALSSSPPAAPASVAAAPASGTPARQSGMTSLPGAGVMGSPATAAEAAAQLAACSGWFEEAQVTQGSGGIDHFERSMRYAGGYTALSLLSREQEAEALAFGRRQARGTADLTAATEAASGQCERAAQAAEHWREAARQMAAAQVQPQPAPQAAPAPQTAPAAASEPAPAPAQQAAAPAAAPAPAEAPAPITEQPPEPSAAAPIEEAANEPAAAEAEETGDAYDLWRIAEAATPILLLILLVVWLEKRSKRATARRAYAAGAHHVTSAWPENYPEQDSKRDF